MNSIIRQALDGEVLSPGATVCAIGRLHPLSGGRVALDLPAGLSISEILERCGCGFSGGYVVHIDCYPILPENFRRIRLKPGTTLTFFPRLEGGSGGTVWKSVLAVVIAVAALIAAPYLAPGVISAFAAVGIAVSATTAGALAAGAIMLAGTLALNALFPTRPADNNVNSSQLNSIQGANNQASNFGPVPVVLGRHRQSPYYAAKPYTEILGNDQYLRLLLCLGYGPLQIDALQIGETPIGSFVIDAIEVRQGFAGDAPITLYPGEVDETDLQIKLDDPTPAPGPWADQITAGDTDVISLDFTAPDGINATDAQGSPINWSVTINVQYRPVGGSSWTAAPDVFFGTNYSPSRQGLSIGVTRGQYEVQARKATPNGVPGFTRDGVLWTAIRSLKSGKAVIFPKPLALIALRIKATDQLSGNIDTINCITTSLVKAYNGTIWVANTASQWPPDLFRHVLQGPANARPAPDSAINLVNLQSWWTYCVANGFKFNQIVASTGSVFDKLADIAAAGRAVPTFIDGQWGVVWDRPADPIVQHFTPRNSWGMQGQRAYAQQPDGWRVSFINEKNGFTQDERIVYDDGFSALNATLFEGLQFPGVTDPDLIWRHGRFHIAQARLRPEQITINTGWENLICTRGDRVRLTHDAMLIGLNSGRTKSVAGQVVSFDETVIIENGKTYGLSFRIAGDARVLTRAVDAAVTAGEYNALTLVGDLTVLDADGGELFAFGETAQESADYRVLAIAHQKDLVAALTLVDDAPAISTADSGAIPPYNPNVTIPADPFTLPPRNLQYSEVIDGSGQGIRALVLLSWQVPRFGTIASFQVQSRNDDGNPVWQTVDSVLPPDTSSELVLPSAGVWSYRVRCIFQNGTASDWISLINLTLLALPRSPTAVSNLRNTYISGRSFISWDNPVDVRTDILIEIRKGATFEAAQIVDDAAVSPWQTLGDDIYFVAAYATSPFGTRVYSAEQSIEVEGSVAIENVIVIHDEGAEGWTGTFEGNVGIDQDDNFLRTSGDFDFLGQTDFLGNPNFLDGDGAQTGGIYWSAHVVDTGGITFCRVSNDWIGVGEPADDDFLGNSDFLSEPDFLSASRTKLVRVRPIIRVSQDGVPDFDDPQVWSPDVYKGWVFQLGMQFETFDANTVAVLTNWSWTIDVPDRLDSYQNLTVGSGGLAITFRPTGAVVDVPFNGGLNGEDLPHLTPSIRNPVDGDLITWSGLSLSGVTLNVMNGGVAVSRGEVNLLVRGY